jgi:hypothetical protein
MQLISTVFHAMAVVYPFMLIVRNIYIKNQGFISLHFVRIVGSKLSQLVFTFLLPLAGYGSSRLLL